MHQHLHGVTVGAALDGEAVFQDNQHHNGNGQHQIGAVGGYCGTVHAPQGVKGNGQSDAHGHALVQKGHRVGLQHLPGLAPLEIAQLIAPLAQGKVEGQKQHCQIQPVGNHNLRHQCAVENPQQEAGHQNGDIHNWHILQPEAVAEIQQEVQCQQNTGKGLEAQGVAHQRGSSQNSCQNAGVSDGHRPGGDGAFALGGVETILLPIPDVVDDVHHRGGHAEGQKAQQTGDQLMGVEELAAAGQSGKYQHIFYGVVGTGELDVGIHRNLRRSVRSEE